MDNSVYVRLRALFLAVLALSLAALGVAAVLGGSDAVWVRGVIVTVLAGVLVALARRAFLGSRGAYLRMRIMTAAGPVAAAALVALPHDGFPGWMKAEQAVIGILLAAAAVVLGRADVRRAYRKGAPVPR
ncbi:hypothetical protein [Streptomyces sp. ODS28]|uniref:hypothetical protein n=1 Tax=Streptomyces sp. ODS28 TaxID=3136688 RepID=UPI0031EB8274